MCEGTNPSTAEGQVKGYACGELERVIRVALLLVLLGCGPKPPPAAPAAGGASGLRHEAASSGSLRERLAEPDGASLVLLYGGEQGGSVDTCGCPSGPRGSLARVESYRERVVRAQPETPVLLVNVGGFYDDTIGASGDLRSDVLAADRWMAQGLALGSWDALNVGYADVAYVEAAGIPHGALSASVRPVQGGHPPWRVFEAGGLRVGITGVSGRVPTFLEPASHTLADPVEALADVLPALREASDVVVVLAYATGQSTRDLALPGVDVIIEAGRYLERWPPLTVGDAIWVRSALETRSLGELRLTYRDGQRVDALDRSVALDDGVPMDPEQDRLRRQAARDLRAQRGALEASLP